MRERRSEGKTNGHECNRCETQCLCLTSSISFWNSSRRSLEGWEQAHQCRIEQSHEVLPGLLDKLTLAGVGDEVSVVSVASMISIIDTDHSVHVVVPTVKIVARHRNDAVLVSVVVREAEAFNEPGWDPLSIQCLLRRVGTTRHVVDSGDVYVVCSKTLPARGGEVSLSAFHGWRDSPQTADSSPEPSTADGASESAPEPSVFGFFLQCPAADADQWDDALRRCNAALAAFLTRINRISVGYEDDLDPLRSGVLSDATVLDRPDATPLCQPDPAPAAVADGDTKSPSRALSHADGGPTPTPTPTPTPSPPQEGAEQTLKPTPRTPRTPRTPEPTTRAMPGSHKAEPLPTPASSEDPTSHVRPHLTDRGLQGTGRYLNIRFRYGSYLDDSHGEPPHLFHMAALGEDDPDDPALADLHCRGLRPTRPSGALASTAIRILLPLEKSHDVDRLLVLPHPVLHPVPHSSRLPFAVAADLSPSDPPEWTSLLESRALHLFRSAVSTLLAEHKPRFLYRLIPDPPKLHLLPTDHPLTNFLVRPVQAVLRDTAFVEVVLDQPSRPPQPPVPTSPNSTPSNVQNILGAHSPHGAEPTSTSTTRAAPPLPANPSTNNPNSTTNGGGSSPAVLRTSPASCCVLVEPFLSYALAGPPTLASRRIAASLGPDWLEGIDISCLRNVGAMSPSDAQLADYFDQPWARQQSPQWLARLFADSMKHHVFTFRMLPFCSPGWPQCTAAMVPIPVVARLLTEREHTWRPLLPSKVIHPEFVKSLRQHHLLALRDLCSTASYALQAYDTCRLGDDLRYLIQSHIHRVQTGSLTGSDGGWTALCELLAWLPANQSYFDSEQLMAIERELRLLEAGIRSSEAHCRRRQKKKPKNVPVQPNEPTNIQRNGHANGRGRVSAAFRRAVRSLNPFRSTLSKLKPSPPRQGKTQGLDVPPIAPDDLHIERRQRARTATPVMHPSGRDVGVRTLDAPVNAATAVDETLDPKHSTIIWTVPVPLPLPGPFPVAPVPGTSPTPATAPGGHLPTTGTFFFDPSADSYSYSALSCALSQCLSSLKIRPPRDAARRPGLLRRVTSRVSRAEVGTASPVTSPKPHDVTKEPAAVVQQPIACEITAPALLASLDPEPLQHSSTWKYMSEGLILNDSPAEGMVIRVTKNSFFSSRSLSLIRSASEDRLNQVA